MDNFFEAVKGRTKSGKHEVVCQRGGIVFCRFGIIRMWTVAFLLQLCCIFARIL